MDERKIDILLLEGKRSDHPSFAFGLTKKGFLVETAPTGAAAVARLKTRLPELIIVDAVSMRTNGRRICRSIRTEAGAVPIILICGSDNQPHANMGADVVVCLPFTLQKLINRIRPLLPFASKDTTQINGLRLDERHHLARFEDHQARLTPRLFTMLKILAEHPGEVIEREQLFRLAWDTSYTADMRSLDVHISWLRQALEDDPRHPRLIKTIRGVGYRFDLGEPPTRPLRRPEKKSP